MALSVILTYNERTKSYVIRPALRDSSGIGYALVLNAVKMEERDVLHARIVRQKHEQEPNSTQVAVFPACLGFLKYDAEIYLVAATEVKEVEDAGATRIKQIVAARAYNLSRSAEHCGILPPELNSAVAYLSSGMFFYSESFDITLNYQQIRGKQHSDSMRQELFTWNHFLLKPVVSLASQIPKDQSAFLLNDLFSKVVKGYFGYRKIKISDDTYHISLHSRVGSKKAGTRFNSRGLDDDGNASIFCETEVLICSGLLSFSYVLLRGSVPVFWEQQGFQLGYPNIQITRKPLATQPAFDRHFQFLEENYGLIHALNLLSSRDGSVESLLTDAFDYHLNNCTQADQLSSTNFDVNRASEERPKNYFEDLFQLISRDVQVFGYYVDSSALALNKEQKGVFRVNCFDCLDRTNAIQDFIARKIVDLFFRNYLIGPTFKQIDSIRIQSCIGTLFADNGDTISKIYAGTGALRSSLTRKGQSTFMDYLEDLTKSATRIYNGHVSDGAKQASVDLILGNRTGSLPVELYNPISKMAQAQLKLRASEYTTKKSVKVTALTWNTGGPFASSLDYFFADFKTLLSEKADVYIVCLQEIVQLNATQIVSSDPEKRILWETLFTELLFEYHGADSFVHVASNQLVGTSLSVFVKSSLVDDVKEVEIAAIKTGLGGMAGNKGSIAIRMQLYDTTICCVGSHFTAGQSAVNERVREHSFVLGNLCFSKSCKILDHDTVFWLGDFNFRIELDGKTVRESVANKAFNELLQYDQLSIAKGQGRAFSEFKEMPLCFAPTYKYDPGTNIYDTSEKNRVPSWTDRIFFRGEEVKGLRYDRSEVDLSDHKPVFLIALCKVSIIDKAVLLKIEQELFSKYMLEDSEKPELPPRPIVISPLL